MVSQAFKIVNRIWAFLRFRQQKQATASMPQILSPKAFPKNNCPKTKFFNPDIQVQKCGFRECLSFSASICHIPAFTSISVGRLWDNLKIGKA
jgi:hypothetical protein